jgi:hypothetical protein
MKALRSYGIAASQDPSNSTGKRECPGTIKVNFLLTGLYTLQNIWYPAKEKHHPNRENMGLTINSCNYSAQRRPLCSVSKAYSEECYL